MRLLTFNHHSINDLSSVEEVNTFFLKLSKGIKKYIVANGIQNSRFFTELENFKKYEIIEGFKVIDAINALSRDLKSIIFDLIAMRCNDDCLNNLSKTDEDKITDYEVLLEDEAAGTDYMILSFTLEKNGILLSFNRNRWNQSSIEILKYKEHNTTKDTIDNISSEEHAIELLDKIILDQLPIKNIIYSKKFNDWLLGKTDDHSPDIDKVISKINECINNGFKIDLKLIKPLNTDVFEIRVGSLGALQHSQIRVLFKFDEEKKYILYGLIKHGENTYDYSGDIQETNQIFNDMKKQGNQ